LLSTGHSGGRCLRWPFELSPGRRRRHPLPPDLFHGHRYTFGVWLDDVLLSVFACSRLDPVQITYGSWLVVVHMNSMEGFALCRIGAGRTKGLL
jgi:hypothetical protein